MRAVTATARRDIAREVRGYACSPRRSSCKRMAAGASAQSVRWNSSATGFTGHLDAWCVTCSLSPAAGVPWCICIRSLGAGSNGTRSSLALFPKRLRKLKHQSALRAGRCPLPARCSRAHRRAQRRPQPAASIASVPLPCRRQPKKWNRRCCRCGVSPALGRRAAARKPLSTSRTTSASPTFFSRRAKATNQSNTSSATPRWASAPTRVSWATSTGWRFWLRRWESLSPQPGPPRFVQITRRLLSAHWPAPTWAIFSNRSGRPRCTSGTRNTARNSKMWVNGSARGTTLRRARPWTMRCGANASRCATRPAFSMRRHWARSTSRGRTPSTCSTGYIATAGRTWPSAAAATA